MLKCIDLLISIQHMVTSAPSHAFAAHLSYPLTLSFSFCAHPPKCARVDAEVDGSCLKEIQSNIYEKQGASHALHALSNHSKVLN
mmetsp:Transcript_23864/g.36805  ORF Transcript_23864/g.36805 Transcript_23864/m.36805 type:complete len:85 (-) Transcript_23864:7-261(-)